jgi:membrane-associated phospholipid phosphatase
MHPLISVVAQWFLIVPAVIVAAVIYFRAQWTLDLVEAAAAGVLTIAFVKASGALRFEPRPFIVEHVRPLVAHAPDNAFPSDHLAACGLAFAYLWPRSKPLAAITLLFAAAIGAARVAAHLHWPIDIATGFVLGALAAAIAHALVTHVPAFKAHAVTTAAQREE